MKTLAAVVLAEVGLGLLPLVLPALVLVLVVAYLLVKWIYWAALGFAVWKVGSTLVARRDRLTKERLDRDDPPPIDKSTGKNTEWSEWFGISQ